MKWTKDHTFILKELENITVYIEERDIQGLFGREPGYMAFRIRNGLKAFTELSKPIIDDLLKKGYLKKNQDKRILITRSGVEKLKEN